MKREREEYREKGIEEERERISFSREKIYSYEINMY
jgi:hypothetical protein